MSGEQDNKTCAEQEEAFGLTERLDQARKQGDPAADAAVAAVADRIWAVNRRLVHVTHNNSALPADLPACLHAIVKPPLPAFTNFERVGRAQRFVNKHLPLITVALLCGCLPASYAAGEGARILARTGRMQRDVDRRVTETGRFVLDVLRPGALEPGGRGLVTTGKVRLIHAAVRRSVNFAPSAPLPINQEEMLGTIGIFSVLVLDAVQRLGVKVSEADAEDFLHFWCVVGAMLGVREDLLPTHMAEAREVFGAIRSRRYEPTTEGRELMGRLLEGLERYTAPVGLRYAPRYLVHYLVGNEVADALACPRAPEAWQKLAQFAVRVARPGALASVLSPLTGRRLLEGMAWVKLGGAEPRYSKPLELS